MVQTTVMEEIFEKHKWNSLFKTCLLAGDKRFVNPAMAVLNY